MFATMMSDMMIKPGQSPVFNQPRDFGFDLNERSFLKDASIITVPTLVLQNNNAPRWT